MTVAEGKKKDYRAVGEVSNRRQIEDQVPVRAARMHVDRLRVHPMNLGRDVGDLRELTASIAEDGVEQALEVQHRGELFEVIDGRRRLLAARMAGVRSVPVLVVPARSDAEVLATVIRTGVHKRMLSDGELRATAVMLQGKYGWSVAVIARRIGVGADTVRQWLVDPTERLQPPRPRAPRRPPVSTRLRERLAVWEERPPVSVAALLDELSAMVAPAAAEDGTR